MKKKYLLIGLITAGFLASCTSPSETEGVDPVKEDTMQIVSTEVTEIDSSNLTSYGPEKVDTTIAISSDELLAKFEGKEELEATFKGTITETCSKMGCWVNISKEDGETFMVRFKDHFTIPVDTEVGTLAYFSGKAIQDTVSVELQQHFLEDANAPQEEIDAITEPKITMTFIADGVELVR